VSSKVNFSEIFLEDLLLSRKFPEELKKMEEFNNHNRSVQICEPSKLRDLMIAI